MAKKLYSRAMPPTIRRPPSPPPSAGCRSGRGIPIVVQSMTNTDTADVAGDRAPGRRAGARRQRAGAGHGQQRRGRGGGPRTSSRGWTASGSRCRSSATSTTTATCCSPAIPTAPAPSPSTASIPATSAASGTTRTSAPSSRSRWRNDKPVRIGVNWGSLDQSLLTEMMDANARRADPRDARDVTMEAMVESALRSAALAEAAGHGATTASCSAPRCRECRTWSTSTACSPPAATIRCTSASPRPGSARKGIIASTAGLSILLQEGIGDTIRVSLTPGAGRRPHRGSAGRAAGAPVAGAPELHAAGDQLPRLRPDHQHLLPGDGPADPGLPAGEDAGVAPGAARRRGDEGRGHGLRGERPGRVEARQHRDLAARHRSRSRRRRCTWTGASWSRSRATASSPSSSEILEEYVASRYGAATSPPREVLTAAARYTPPCAAGRQSALEATLRDQPLVAPCRCSSPPAWPPA